MILRPVRPQSPLGPPISNAPVGFTRYFTLPFTRCLGSTGLMMLSMTASSICLCDRPGACCVESTTVSIASGLPCAAYFIVTCDFASGRSHASLPLRRTSACFSTSRCER